LTGQRTTGDDTLLASSSITRFSGVGGLRMLSVLAAAIYDVLRVLVPNRRAEITYAELVDQLGPMPPPNQDLHARDVRLDAALGELVTACRRRGLPAIAAIVVRDDTRAPGQGYYSIAHAAEAGDTDIAMIAWGHEVQQVRATTYPAHL
jgi:hypothetical protein